jgi:hypothetical protein
MVCICDGFFTSSMQRVTDEEGTALVKLAEDAASNKKVRFNSVVLSLLLVVVYLFYCNN